MLLFLLPLLFNPLSLIINWLPALYLAAWPIIIQTLGRESLVTHALVLILFILTCDITRQMMLKTIGFDLLSFPLGIALLFALTTDRGSLFLSLIQPVFSGLLIIVEPLFLLIEIYLFMDMIKSFNRWISEQANARDEDSHDLSSWEPPLSRGAVVARIFILLITISSYIGVYMIIQESKLLIGAGQDVPTNFNHAIATLVTLQLIAFSATIYKEEGVLSESALVALLASMPIFIASWSYYHLKATTDNSSSSWTSYLPSSIFGGSSSSSSAIASTTAADALGLGAAQGTQLFEELARQLPVGSFQLPRPLANLTLEKLAKFYFGPDFWCILAGRFLCLFWWTLKQNPGSGAEAEQWSRQARAAIHQQQTQTDGSRAGQARALWRSLNASLPIRRRTLIKVLLVLAYAQMIIQQMDNKHHLQSQINLLGAQPSDGASGAAGCCGASVHSPESGSAGAEDTTNPKTGENLAAWFNCMWTSAKNCAAAHQDPRPASDSPGTTRFARYCSYLAAWFARMMDQLTDWARTLRRLVASVDLVQLVSVWLARWRSVIVQRLAQSALVQLYYIQRVLFIYE